MLVAFVPGPAGARPGMPASMSQLGRPALASPPPVLTITAREYAFDGPDSIESGPTAFRLVSVGREQHFLGLMRIVDSHTLADYRRALVSKSTPSWVIPAGGVGTISPGTAATTILNLEPGLYAMLCDMEDSHGTPHMMKGMLRALTVSLRGNGATMPTPDLMINLTEFAFLAPDNLQPGLRAIGVRNTGSQPHMALVWRLAPGKSVREVIHWLDTPSDKSHPVTLVGGVPDLAPGQEAQLSIHLRVGRYLLICLVEDPQNHKAHYDKGMTREFTVSSPKANALR
jgi:uncharacterized cupredoxin-like copper-binding protein